MCVCVCVGGGGGSKKNLFPRRMMTFSGAHQRRVREGEREVYRRQIGCRFSLLCSRRKFVHRAVCVCVCGCVLGGWWRVFFFYTNRQGVYENKQRQRSS